MDNDQELLDRFAIAAMGVLEVNDESVSDDQFADDCWALAIAMKQARDRICTTAKPAPEHIPPFPVIDKE